MTSKNVKNFDPNTAVPVKVKRVKKKVKDQQKQEAVAIVSDNPLSYLIFNLQEVSEKYNLSYEKIVMLIYLKELSVFALDIKIVNRKVKLTEYLSSGLITLDYSVKKNLYKVSDLGSQIISDLQNSIKNSSSFYTQNRQTDIDVDNKIKSALSGLFDR